MSGADTGEAAYQGRPGAFSEIAARAFVGDAAALVPCPTFGAVVEALDRVRAHAVALAQCRRFFAAHPHLVAVPEFDTAGAVEAVVADGRGDDAALASVRAARVHTAVVLREAVQDVAANATRFLALARRCDAPAPISVAPLRLAVWTGPDAALADTLRRCADAGWSLRHLERRPSPTAGVGRFVLEFSRTGAQIQEETDGSVGDDGETRRSMSWRGAYGEVAVEGRSVEAL